MSGCTSPATLPRVRRELSAPSADLPGRLLGEPAEEVAERAELVGVEVVHTGCLQLPPDRLLHQAGLLRHVPEPHLPALGVRLLDVPPQPLPLLLRHRALSA